MYQVFHVELTEPSISLKCQETVEKALSQMTRPVQTMVLDTVMPNVPKMSNSSMEKETQMDGTQVPQILMLELASMELAAWSSIFGKLTAFRRHSLLILAPTMLPLDAKELSAVRVIKDSKEFVTRTVAISPHTETETTTSMDQEVTSLSTQPRNSQLSLNSTLLMVKMTERSSRSEENTSKMARLLRLQRLPLMELTMIPLPTISAMLLRTISVTLTTLRTRVVCRKCQRLSPRAWSS